MTALDTVVAPVPDTAAEPAGAPTASALRVHQRLAARGDLRPCPQVDTLFGELVDLVTAAPIGTGPRLLTDPRHREERRWLRALCAEGEYQLELHWARRVAAAADPRAELEGFPYLGNYRRLSRFELDVLARGTTRLLRRVAFVGSGPLPLSALLLAEALDVPVDCIDRDPRAVEAGRAVAEALLGAATPGNGASRPVTPAPGASAPGASPASGASAPGASAPGASVPVTPARHLGAGHLTFVHADVLDLDAAPYDLVVLAALVGAERAGKRAALAQLAGSMAPGAALLARSARADRTLLYPPLDHRDLDGFDLQAVVHPVCEVINSVVLARTPTRGPRPARCPLPAGPAAAGAAVADRTPTRPEVG